MRGSFWAGIVGVRFSADKPLGGCASAGVSAKGSAPSPAQRFPDRKKPGLSFDEFFAKKKPDAEG